MSIGRPAQTHEHSGLAHIACACSPKHTSPPPHTQLCVLLQPYAILTVQHSVVVSFEAAVRVRLPHGCALTSLTVGGFLISGGLVRSMIAFIANGNVKPAALQA